MPRPGSSLLLAAVLAGLLWSIGAIDLSRPQPERVALLLAGAALAFATLRGLPTGALAGVYAVLIAAAERIPREPLADGSDVVRATREAIEVFLAGGNPYTHTLQSTIPVGSPFVYPPGEFLFYLPAYALFGDISRVETATGVLTVAAIVAAGPVVGFARTALPAMLYATWGIAAFRTQDGGNDVSAAFLATVALVALAHTASPRPSVARAAFVVSAVALGWALAFKQFAAVLFPLVLRHLAVSGAAWRRYAAIALVVAAAFIVPFLLLAPGPFISQQLAAVTFHDIVWGANLLAALAPYAPVEDWTGVFFALEVALTAIALALALRARLRSIGAAALAAAGVLAIALMLARWTTQSYYVYAATLALAGWALLEARAGAHAGAGALPRDGQ